MKQTLIMFFACTACMLSSLAQTKPYTAKVNDTCWRVDYYVASGPLTRIESYKDKKKTIAHGRFAFYDVRGWADSTGFLADGLRTGTWYYYNDKGKVYLSRQFREGIMVGEKQYEEEPKERKNEPLPEGEMESEFKGAAAGWQRYLNKNLRYPREAIQTNAQGEVRIAFMVDTEGIVRDVWVFKSVGYSLDKESARLLEESPAWTPAIKDNHPVKSFKIQPIRYRLP